MYLGHTIHRCTKSYSVSISNNPDRALQGFITAVESTKSGWLALLVEYPSRDLEVLDCWDKVLSSDFSPLTSDACEKSSH